MSVVWMVAQREVRTRMLTKSNIISLAVMVAVIVIGVGVLSYFADRDENAPAERLGVAAGVEALEPHLAAAAELTGVEVEVVPLGAEEGRAAVGADGDEAVRAYLEGDPAAPTMVVEATPDPELLQVVTAAVQAYAIAEQVEALGGDAGDVQQAVAGAAPVVEPLEPAEEGGFDGPAYLLSTVMISLLLFALIGSGSIIAMGVVEEKTSRVVEILLATIRPTQLLAGKIVGIGLYGLFQVALLSGALFASLAVFGVMDDVDVDVSGALGWLLLWFLLGYVIFALLFGGFAALVSRQEEIGSVTTPLMFLLFVPFYVTMFLVPNDPDTTLVRVLSQIPFFSPFMMPVRDAFGSLAPWEMPLAIAITLVTIPLLVLVAARVYQRGVLHTGGRMKLTDALRADRTVRVGAAQQSAVSD